MNGLGKKYIFILNPTAGKQKAFTIRDRILKKFYESGVEDSCVFEVTRKPGHATELAKKYSMEYGRNAIIYACGGDGTINEVVNGMVGSDSILSVIPAGTGNDFIKSAFKKRKADDIISGIFDYKIKDIDIPGIDGKFFANIASIGFDSIVAAKAKEVSVKAKFLGRSAYFVAAFICLFGKIYSEIEYELVCIDDRGEEYKINEKKEIILAALANGAYYGGMFNPSPHAVIDDGILNVCLVSRLSIIKLLLLLPKYMVGTHLNNKAVNNHKVKSGWIKGVGEKLIMNFDGESVVKDEINFEIGTVGLKLAYY